MAIDTTVGLFLTTGAIPIMGVYIFCNFLTQFNDQVTLPRTEVNSNLKGTGGTGTLMEEDDEAHRFLGRGSSESDRDGSLRHLDLRRARSTSDSAVDSDDVYSAVAHFFTALSYVSMHSLHRHNEILV